MTAVPVGGVSPNTTEQVHAVFDVDEAVELFELLSICQWLCTDAPEHVDAALAVIAAADGLTAVVLARDLARCCRALMAKLR